MDNVLDNYKLHFNQEIETTTEWQMQREMILNTKNVVKAAGPLTNYDIQNFCVSNIVKSLIWNQFLN